MEAKMRVLVIDRSEKLRNEITERLKRDGMLCDGR
jgi:hypothetical protein